MGVLATATIVAVLTPGLIVGPAGADGADNRDDTWRSVLQRAARAAVETSYAGETMWVTHEDGESRVALLQVHSADGDLTVSASPWAQTDTARYTVRLSDDGGGLTALEDKYDVTLAGTARMLDRPCTRIEIHRRADDLLRERLWIDDATGLVLRRETYDPAGEPVRMAVYLALDLDPDRVDRVTAAAARAATRMGSRDEGVLSVDDEGLDALRDAGWTVPEELPGGYAARGVFALSSTEGQPLHVVYGDGLYSVSLFQQPGRPDWDSLPAGAERADDVGFPAYEWPGAVPQRLVWEAGGTTWSLVGDAPPDEFVAIAAALPQPGEPQLVERFSRGLRRLWSWVSPWN